MTGKQLTVIFAPIRTDLIERALETLYKYTPPMFRVILIDQTVSGLNSNIRDRYKNLLYLRTPKTDVHSTGNLGFSKANNLGISLVETPYFMLCNDDVEFIDRRWWWGVMAAFDKADASVPDRPTVMVCPGSVKLPDWSVGRPSGDDFYILPYKKNYSTHDYDHLLNDSLYVNEHLTLQPGSVIDGVTLYAPVIKTDLFLEVGFLPEQHFPGGGEDYWWNCRASMFGYRCVGTTMSWVFHHWSKSLSAADADEIRQKLDEPELRWNNNHEDWGERFDIWGIRCEECHSVMRVGKDNDTVATCPNHPDQSYQMPQAKNVPL